MCLCVAKCSLPGTAALKMSNLPSFSVVVNLEIGVVSLKHHP